MVKKIIGVIVGYLVDFAAVFAMFSSLYMILGASGSFQEGNYNASLTWLLVGLVVFFIGAALAGFVYQSIAKAENAFIMAGVILCVGILIGILQISQDPGVTVRESGEVALFDAMDKGRQPIWALIVNPLVGFIGAMFGGRFKK